LKDKPSVHDGDDHKALYIYLNLKKLSILYKNLILL